MRVGRMWKWGIAAILSAVAFAAFTRIVGERSIFVTVQNDREGRLHVSWRACGSRQDAPEYAVSLYPEGPSAAREFECNVMPVRGTGYVPLKGDWLYGSVPAGYRISGSCPTLQKGRAYRVSVGTWGDAVFSLRDDGGADVTERWCSWWKDW
jgi:hypothetical protein